MGSAFVFKQSWRQLGSYSKCCDWSFRVYWPHSLWIQNRNFSIGINPINRTTTLNTHFQFIPRITRQRLPLPDTFLEQIRRSRPTGGPSTSTVQDISKLFVTKRTGNLEFFLMPLT